MVSVAHGHGGMAMTDLEYGLSVAVFIHFLLNFKVQCRLRAAGLDLLSDLSWVSFIPLYPPVSARPSSGCSFLNVLSSLEILTIPPPISEQSEITLVPPQVYPGHLRIPPSSLNFLFIL